MSDLENKKTANSGLIKDLYAAFFSFFSLKL